MTLADNTTLKAHVHTELPRYDLAILRVPVKKRLKALAFGAGSDLLVSRYAQWPRVRTITDTH